MGNNHPSWNIISHAKEKDENTTLSHNGIHKGGPAAASIMAEGGILILSLAWEMVFHDGWLFAMIGFYFPLSADPFYQPPFPDTHIYLGPGPGPHWGHTAPNN